MYLCNVYCIVDIFHWKFNFVLSVLIPWKRIFSKKQGKCSSISCHFVYKIAAQNRNKTDSTQNISTILLTYVCIY